VANATTIALLQQFPLTTKDAAGLRADIQPAIEFQPAFVLRRDPDDTINIPISASGDFWQVLLAPKGPMPDYAFYPIGLTASFVASTFAAAFWRLEANYSINSPFERDWTWKAFDLATQRGIFNGTTTPGTQSATPVLAGFPPAPIIADSSVILRNALGGFQFRVDTFDATTAAAMTLNIDARWLAFPRSATRNAAFYMPRLGFNLS